MQTLREHIILRDAISQAAVAVLVILLMITGENKNLLLIHHRFFFWDSSLIVHRRTNNTRHRAVANRRKYAPIQTFHIFYESIIVCNRVRTLIHYLLFSLR